MIAALIGTGIYMRKAEAGSASSEKRNGTSASAPATAPVNPAPMSAAGPVPATPAPAASDVTPAAPPATPTTAATEPLTPERAPRSIAKPKSASQAAGAPQREATRAVPPEEGAQPQASAASAEILDRLEQDLDALSTRAVAVDSSLDRLQQEQARQGLGLRGDMAARQQSMRANMSKAQDALEKRDATRARKSGDLAQRDIEALEQFLGR